MQYNKGKKVILGIFNRISMIILFDYSRNQILKRISHSSLDENHFWVILYPLINRDYRVPNPHSSRNYIILKDHKSISMIDFNQNKIYLTQKLNFALGWDIFVS